MLCSLVFSVIISCSGHKEQTSNVTVRWEGNRAVGITIPPELYRGVRYESIEQLVQVRLRNAHAPILGEFRFIENNLVFRPLIPFTHGLKYELDIGGKAVQAFEIPAVSSPAPQVVSVYPTGDTLPENLLKFYVEFSQPMQEGNVLKNISVIKNDRDTVPVFLDIELWNKEKTMLTLWLDPGRIKRDLQPNLKMGPPLEQGAHYRLMIKSSWRDAEGVVMKEAYFKYFTAGLRDTLSPDPGLWTIVAPKAGTADALKIYLHEPLDHTLLKNAIFVIDNSDGHIMKGSFETASAETVLNFIPSVQWGKGEYKIRIEERFEDLAGNKLDRLFDNDIARHNNRKLNIVNQRVFRIQ